MKGSPDLTLVVPVAGRGSRLAPQTEHAPKCLLRVAERPILDFVLGTALALPLRRIVLVIGQNGDLIRASYGKYYRGVPLIYVQQDRPRGLTHAITLAQSLVKELMLIILGDELYVGAKHFEMLDRFNSAGDALCGFVHTAEQERIRRNYGLELRSDNRITRLIEKPAVPWNDLLGVGTWLVRADFFQYVDRTPVDELRRERDFVAVLQQMIAEGRNVRGFDLGGEYFNINTPADLVAANRTIRSG
jgi:dTDP-glucose pyrophosphorylase